MSAEPQRWFFVHLQKTSGTALIWRLKRQFSPREMYPHPDDGPVGRTALFVPGLVERFAVRRDEIRLIAGHFPLAVTELLGAPFSTFTLLRNPVEVVLSSLRARQQIDLAGKSLEEIYDDPMHHFIIRNAMVRAFSLRGDEIRRGLFAEVEFTPERLEWAKQGLASVDAIGMQDDIEGFCGELNERWGWDLGDPVVANTTAPAVESPALRERIVEDNRDDIELYEFGRSLVRSRR